MSFSCFSWFARCCCCCFCFFTKQLHFFLVSLNIYTELIVKRFKISYKHHLKKEWMNWNFGNWSELTPHLQISFNFWQCGIIYFTPDQCYDINITTMLQFRRLCLLVGTVVSLLKFHCILLHIIIIVMFFFTVCITHQNILELVLFFFHFSLYKVIIDNGHNRRQWISQIYRFIRITTFVQYTKFLRRNPLL